MGKGTINYGINLGKEYACIVCSDDRGDQRKGTPCRTRISHRRAQCPVRKKLQRRSIVMERTSIDFGIDLGTTNSSAAERSSGNLRVFKDHEERETVPSAIFINRSNELIVGRKAKERVESDPEDAFCEFKLSMGEEREYLFKRSGRRMKPEDLSAEVLKSLLGNIQQRTGHRPEAAVITVPAAFDLPQNNATTRAAQLAGLRVSPLLTEPVAAAYAYGFQEQRDDVFWLVYDFGGGTFDAAVIAVRDGMIEVVTHEGDNHLGGKNIDWKIVEELLIPKVAKEFRVTDFHRGGPDKWLGAIAKLKGAAEEAKIQLSRSESTDIHIDFLCQDDRGEAIEFDYTLTRQAVAGLAEPLIARSIDICKRSLVGRRLETRAIEKVLLVGGPTRMPYLRQRLEEELRIPLEFTIDPMTIVAQGAALFASTQRLETVPTRPTIQGEFALVLEGKRMGPEPEPFLGGKVMGATRDLGNYTIEFINQTAAASWRSGHIKLSADGTFLVTLWAEKGRVNRFAIELRNAVGTLCKTTPTHWEYEVGLAPPEQTMMHSLCIELENRQALVFFKKDQGLPARKKEPLHTSEPFVRGQVAPLLRIPVYEGEFQQANRNKYIGELLVTGEKCPRDLPKDTEVEVTIEIDASRNVTVKAFIPLLDDDFSIQLHLGGQRYVHTTDQLSELFREEYQRWTKLLPTAERAGDTQVLELLSQIENTTLPGAEEALKRAVFDHEARVECDNRLRSLRQALDELETLLEWPTLTKKAKDDLESTLSLAQDIGSSADKQACSNLEQEIRQIITGKPEVETLRRKLAELGGLRWRMWLNHFPTLVELFQELEQRQADFRDQQVAQQLFIQGRQAIERNNLQMLRGAVTQLFGLMEEPPPPPRPRLGGTLKK